MKLPWQCSIEQCENPKTMGLNVCESHRLQALRAARKSAREPKHKAKIKKVSAKRQAQLIEYERRRKKFMAEHNKCEVAFCRRKSEHVHHQKGREGMLLLDERFWMAVCAEHHEKITRDSRWAIDNHYSYPRNQKQTL